MTTMLKTVMGTVLMLAMGAGASGQTPPPPPAPPTAGTPPTPAVAPAPRAAPSRQPAPRDPDRAWSRARRGPWVYAVGDPLTASFTGQPGDVMELVNTSGDIVITGGRGREGRVVARRKAGGRTEAEARALVEQMRLELGQHSQRVVVRALPADKANAYRLDYEITLPEGMGVEVRNVTGSVTVNRVGGDVRVEAVSGDITGQGLARVRTMRTMSGDIALSASTLVGEANLQTVSGDVRATSLKAASATLGSVSGSIQVRDGGCERVTIRTVNGDIQFDSPALDGGRYELKTHAGTISVATGARSAGFQFEAQTFKGHIQSETAPGRAPGAATRQLTGRVGDGSAFFELTSFVGDIVIKR